MIQYLVVVAFIVLISCSNSANYFTPMRMFIHPSPLIGSGSTVAEIPSAFNSDTSLSLTPAVLPDAHTSTPIISRGTILSRFVSVPRTVKCARDNVVDNCAASGRPSGSAAYVKNFTWIPALYGCNDLTIKACCATSNARGASFVSRAAILLRCSDAICSSDANSPMLKSASKNIPTSTYQKATYFTSCGNLSASYIIPIPNSTPAAISNCRKYGFIAERNGSDIRNSIGGKICGISLLLIGTGLMLVVSIAKRKEINQRYKRELEILRRNSFP